MGAVLDGIRVVDLSQGVAGPMTSMLLADHGADVIRVEPPEGDPFRSSGYQVWQRGKRNAVLDLHETGGRQVFLDLVRGSDVVVESFAPGTADRLGIGYGALRELNPPLIYCSITGYGSTGRLADRPGIDALVAARTGQQWEPRGVDDGTLTRLAGVPGRMAGFDAPSELRVGAPRPGPLFGGVPWAGQPRPGRNSRPPPGATRMPGPCPRIWSGSFARVQPNPGSRRSTQPACHAR